MHQERALRDGIAGDSVASPRWLTVFRSITRATDERTSLFAGISWSAVSHSAGLVHCGGGRAVAWALMMGNMNSLPLDWVTRTCVGGANLSHYLVKQLPVLPPRSYLNLLWPGGMTYAEAVAGRVLELTYTTDSMAGFARDLGYRGPPFPWDDRRRHRLKCELDAVFAHMYGLDRAQLAWILDSTAPASRFRLSSETSRELSVNTGHTVMHYMHLISCERASCRV